MGKSGFEEVDLNRGDGLLIKSILIVYYTAGDGNIYMIYEVS
jgi:hypothetical protein